MTLYNEATDFAAWQGDPINGVRYPLSISGWSAADLEAIGLWRDDMIAPADPVPEGKVVLSRSVQRVGGVVQWLQVLGDAPEPGIYLPPLTARQLRLGLIAAGVTLSSVDAAIAAIPDPTEREIATVEWEYASQFERDHSLIEQVGNALGMTVEQIDAAWLAAMEL